MMKTLILMQRGRIYFSIDIKAYLAGSNRIAEEVSKKIGRQVEFRGQGRPRKQKK